MENSTAFSSQISHEDYIQYKKDGKGLKAHSKNGKSKQAQVSSKIDWNLKYAFPKKLKTGTGAKILKQQCFEYCNPGASIPGLHKSSMMMGKIDVFNKHLEHKIPKANNLLTSSSEDYKTEGYDDSDDGIFAQPIPAP
jgi:hypothetical protein